MRKPAIGTRHAMNIAARKTPSSVCDWIEGSRTDSGWMSGFERTSSGQRKSFHDARTAKTETLNSERSGDGRVFSYSHESAAASFSQLLVSGHGDADLRP